MKASYNIVAQAHRPTRGGGQGVVLCDNKLTMSTLYAPEPVALNDFFTMSYFTPPGPAEVWKDPRPRDGWICGSHIVILQGGDIVDPARGDRVPALGHHSMERFTKRIFRVVPADHARGL